MTGNVDPIPVERGDENDIIDAIPNHKFVINEYLAKTLINPSYREAILIGFDTCTGLKISNCCRTYKIEYILNPRLIEYDMWKYIPFLAFKDAVRGIPLVKLHRMREAAAGNPILRDASLAVLALLRLQKETGETLAGLSALLPPFVRRAERIPAPGVRASAVRRLGDPDGDGVYRAAEGGGVRVIPEAAGYRLIAEAYSAEYAEELLSETEQKLKTLLRE